MFGPGAIVEVEYVNFTTIPSGVTASTPIPIIDYDFASHTSPILQDLAAGIERFMATPEVAGMVYHQDIGSNGLVEDRMTITVQYFGTKVGQLIPFYGDTDVLLNDFNAQAADTTIGPAVAKVLAQLQAVANE